MATKKTPAKKAKVKTPKAKEVVYYRHWNGESYEQRKR
jgi:hypothetical protein|tara:strand:+ start:109 stop:222 length:114 start_codon:yes stop_codon:yes gene_type:complete